MSANPFTIVTNDPTASVKTGVGRHEMKEDDGGALAPTKTWLDDVGIVAQIGRGVSDPNITYVALYNTGGTKCYVYPNAAGTGIIVSATQP